MTHLRKNESSVIYTNDDISLKKSKLLLLSLLLPTIRAQSMHEYSNGVVDTRSRSFCQTAIHCTAYHVPTQVLISHVSKRVHTICIMQLDYHVHDIK